MRRVLVMNDLMMDNVVESSCIRNVVKVLQGWQAGEKDDPRT